VTTFQTKRKKTISPIMVEPTGARTNGRPNKR